MAGIKQKEILSELIESELLVEVASLASSLDLALVLDLFSHSTAIEEVGESS